MKKITTALVVVMLAIGIIACAPNNEEPVATPPTPSADTTVIIPTPAPPQSGSTEDLAEYKRALDLQADILEVDEKLRSLEDTERKLERAEADLASALKATDDAKADTERIRESNAAMQKQAQDDIQAAWANYRKAIDEAEQRHSVAVIEYQNEIARWKSEAAKSRKAYDKAHSDVVQAKKDRKAELKQLEDKARGYINIITRSEACAKSFGFNQGRADTWNEVRQVRCDVSPGFSQDYWEQITKAD